MTQLKLYADNPGRRLRQMTSDAFFVLWTVFWIWLATRVYDTIMPLAGPGAKLQAAGQSMASNMTSAGQWLDRVPVVGDEIRSPFDSMSEASNAIADAGADQQQVVHNAALLLSVSLALLAVSVLLIVWLPLRVRFVRRASAAKAYLNARDDVDLFALRALARQPLTALVRIDEDPAAAWRRGDPVVIRRLAALELREEGLVLPGVTDAT